jgi:hypothetical protein
MKRLTLFMLLAFLIGIPAGIQAQHLSPTVFVQAGVRMAFQRDVKTGLGSGFGFSIALSRKTRLGLNLSYGRHPVAEGNEPRTLYYKNYTAAPFLIYVQQELIGGRTFSTYASLGAGVQFSGLQNLSLVVIPENTVVQSIASGFVMRAAGGVTLAVLSGFRLYAEGAYLSGRATGKTQTFFLRRLIQEKKFRFDLEAVEVCLGIQYYF